MPVPDPTLSEGDSDTQKWCTNCGLRKSVFEFDADQSRPDGRRDVCKVCRAEIRKSERDKLHAESILALEDEGLETLKTLGSGGSFTPHSNELLEAIMRPFGGVSGYAKHLFATYLACEPGSARRVQMHKLIMDLAQQVTAIGQSEKQLEEMEDQDLRLLMVRYLAEFQQRANLPQTAIPTLEGKIVDAGREIAGMVDG